jgi:hypothetical protein
MPHKILEAGVQNINEPYSLIRQPVSHAKTTTCLCPKKSYWRKINDLLLLISGLTISIRLTASYP